MNERGITNEDLAGAFRCNEKIVRWMREGLRPIPMHKVGLLPSEKLRVLFHDAFLAAARRAGAAAA